MVGYAMMHAVGGEPIYALYVDAHRFNHAFADVLPLEFVILPCGFVAHRADESHPPVSLQGKDGQKVCFFQADVDVAIHRGSAAFYVSDIKEVSVDSTGKSDLQSLAHGGVSAVASGKVGG